MSKRTFPPKECRNLETTQKKKATTQNLYLKQLYRKMYLKSCYHIFKF